jgi:hypothetical protein
MSDAIPLDALVIDPEVQPRVKGLDGDHVDEMVEFLSRSPANELPPVRVFSGDSGHVLSRGVHRAEAYKRSGRTHIPAEVVEGDTADAAVDASGSNQDHGLKRTPDDKRRAIARVLRLRPEWADSRIAEHVGTSDKTVADERAGMESTSEIPKLDRREGKDGRSRPATREKKVKVESPVGGGAEDSGGGGKPPESDVGDDPDPPDEPEAFWKPKDSFADEVQSALRKLKHVKAAVSMVFESPHSEHAVVAGKAQRLRWSTDGEDTVSERLGVKVMRRTWTCDEFDRLFYFLCELEAWLRKDTPAPPEAQPWE